MALADEELAPGVRSVAVPVRDSREAFHRMVADPDHQQVTRLRTAALTEAVLQATTPW